METKKIKVLLVDDHMVVRAGFRMLLDSQPYIGDIVDIERGELAVKEYERFQPDVVVMDLSMPGIGGLEAIRRLCKHYPNVLILVYSIHDEKVYIERALEAGARGYVSKNSAAEVLAQAVAVIASGKRYIEEGLMPEVNDICLTEAKKPKHKLKLLSPREFDVFRLLSKGLNAHNVASELCLSYKTICNYNTQIKSKLNANTSADLANIAMVNNII
ncbi:response regulator transcription factor [Colwellia sp. 1_MG-2023]|uniref:response regulator transcription factor n=1 Tax=unclassified Colwellia TaxID=196834 RepID=UPI001C0860D9|nr:MULTISPECIES: response regulator transcription factor [unclassified Colwellia]MBU2924010.1 response regulator transcription factor [Colwellia sp. C2M11]MDO6488736.1 response regulator transcription factor [Colwellia sp. 6_MG-2023]MDO6653621.1 response regulator transcription factor [Colwellia sp. 3_MG-2023]MDO6666554.1 response regulator transcription factor [Colwellia sp. 2_MG-2023]MDO6690997.1 response regulator transcription factor [Colwellia sp. 1_MG-2023]